MEVRKKLTILADAAKYDASCASSGSKRSRGKNELGDTNGIGICHSYTPDGRCISLLKILLTNYCIYDCLYCVNRISNDVERARFTPEEIVNLTLGFYQRNYIEGLFLSSGIIKSPDYTAELLTKVAKDLRTVHSFAGYIHLKAAPGTSKEILDEMSRWCDRISANIELPTEVGLNTIAPAKSHQQVQETMGSLKDSILHRNDERKSKTKLSRFGTRSQSTQMIVGATAASDYDILLKADALYKNFGLSRVYYSGYSPIPNSDPILPAKSPPLVREHRLYQADWLQRFYHFKVNEIVSLENPQLDLELDPKLAWALNNRHFFPLNINTASKEALLRVPGFGTTSVFKILKARRFQKLTDDNLKMMRVPIGKAKFFIETASSNSSLNLLDTKDLKLHFLPPKQLSLFTADQQDIKYVQQTLFSSITGQL